MAAPSPDYIIDRPPPLNQHAQAFPYLVDFFDADTVLRFAGLEAKDEYRPQPAGENPNRWAD